MTTRRAPASIAADEVRDHRVRARGLDDQVRTVQARGSCRPEPGRPRTADGSRPLIGRGRAAMAACDRVPKPAVAEDDRRHVVSLALLSRATGRSSGQRKTAVTIVVPRPLEPPFPGGPDPSLTCRSEPQGPCLPAGPPELLLGLLREETAVHAASLAHFDWLMQAFRIALRPASMRWYTSAVPRHRRRSRLPRLLMRHGRRVRSRWRPSARRRRNGLRAAIGRRRRRASRVPVAPAAVQAGDAGRTRTAPALARSTLAAVGPDA